jgi:hypothetical protein
MKSMKVGTLKLGVELLESLLKQSLLITNSGSWEVLLEHAEWEKLRLEVLKVRQSPMVILLMNAFLK